MFLESTLPASHPIISKIYQPTFLFFEKGDACLYSCSSKRKNKHMMRRSYIFVLVFHRPFNLVHKSQGLSFFQPPIESSGLDARVCSNPLRLLWISRKADHASQHLQGQTCDIMLCSGTDTYTRLTLRYDGLPQHSHCIHSGRVQIAQSDQWTSFIFWRTRTGCSNEMVQGSEVSLVLTFSS